MRGVGLAGSHPAKVTPQPSGRLPARFPAEDGIRPAEQWYRVTAPWTAPSVFEQFCGDAVGAGVSVGVVHARIEGDPNSGCASFDVVKVYSMGVWTAHDCSVSSLTEGGSGL